MSTRRRRKKRMSPKHEEHGKKMKKIGLKKKMVSRKTDWRQHEVLGKRKA
jgi:hypothetical protein